MTEPLRGIILSDVDGTFLDGAYRPAMDAAQFASVLERWRVVWVSSRTVDELVHLQSELGHADDAIAESGGVILARDERVARALGSPVARDGVWRVRVADKRETTSALARRVFADEGVAIRTFDDIDAAHLARLSGYTRDEATRALRREASVVIVNADSHNARVAQATAHLRQIGCDVTNGGRWISVLRGSSKGDAARAWLAATHSHRGGPQPMVVAVGDAENDTSLLAVAQHRFVIARTDDGHHPALASYPGARMLQRPGVAGWREMIELLANLD